MKNFKFYISLLILFTITACQKNPFTGKKDLALVKNSELFPMSFQQYDEVLEEEKVITGTTEAQMVKSVGKRITEAAERYLNSKGQNDYLADYDWDYNLIESNQVNAWCMPGGKIAIYTGILPITQDEAGLAAVMGHEVSHALLNHSQRKISQEAVTQGLGQLGSTALGGSEYGQIFDAAYGVGYQVGVSLPYSRKYETQADELGIELMAIAGYNPQAAVDLWERMNDNDGQKVSEFLSTHPSNESRINNLSKNVEGAKQVAKKFGVTSFK